MPYSILHLDSETGWRGGQRQVKLLVKGLSKKVFTCHFMGPANGVLYQKLQNEASCTPLEMKGLHQFLAPFKLKKYCETHEIDLIDCHSSGAHSVAFMAAQLGLKIPIIVHRRVDYTPTGWSSRYKYLSKTVVKYVAISKYIGTVLQDYGVPPDRITIVRSAVKDQHIDLTQKKLIQNQIKSKYSIDHQTKIFLNTAALTEQKDHATLIKSASILKSAGQNFHLLICGDGHLKPQITRQISAAGLDHCVSLCGHVQNINDYYLAADFFVISSRDEGLGTSILDAIQFNIPVIATSAGGIPEIVLDGKTGLLSAPEEPAELAKNMLKMLRDKSSGSGYVKNAADHLIQNFKLHDMIRGNAEVYEDVLDHYLCELG